MNRQQSCFSVGLLALALALALAAGLGLSRIGAFSARWIDKTFAVPYQIELRTGAGTLELPDVVLASVSDGRITVSAASTGSVPVTLSLNDAVLTAVDPGAIQRNRLRAGLLTLLLLGLALLCPMMLAASALLLFARCDTDAVPARSKPAFATRRPLHPSTPNAA